MPTIPIAEAKAKLTALLREVASSGARRDPHATSTTSSTTPSTKQRAMPIVSLLNLIASKRTGRPQDVADVLMLEELQHLRADF